MGASLGCSPLALSDLPFYDDTTWGPVSQIQSALLDPTCDKPQITLAPGAS